VVEIIVFTEARVLKATEPAASVASKVAMAMERLEIISILVTIYRNASEK